jgi:hypothetical protein
MPGNDFVNVNFSYTQNGKTVNEILKVQKGVSFSDQYNTYSVNEKGEIIQQYTPENRPKPVKSIDITEEYMKELKRISSNSQDQGLSRKDYELENIRVSQQNAMQGAAEPSKPWYYYLNPFNWGK